MRSQVDSSEAITGCNGTEPPRDRAYSIGGAPGTSCPERRAAGPAMGPGRGPLEVDVWAMP